MSLTLINEDVHKDSVGQKVVVGDIIAYKVAGYSSLKLGKINSFTKGGTPRVAVTNYKNIKVYPAIPSSYCKIFAQDLNID